MSRRESEIDAFRSDTITEQTLNIHKIDIHTSISTLASAAPSLDDVLRKCGDFGRFQFIHYFLLHLIAASAGIISFYYVFGAATPNHRCRLPIDILPNDTQYSPTDPDHQMYLSQYIPTENDGKTWIKCQRYKIDDINDTLIDCPNGWVYDRSVFGYTFTEEANFVCHNEAKKSWLATAIQCGGFSLLIIGSLADKYGRKKLICIVTMILLVTRLITQIIMQWVPMAINTKFFVLFLNQLASGLVCSTYSLIFILALELTSTTHTSFAGNLMFVSFTLGEIIVALFAFKTQHWEQLKWVNTAFVIIGLPCLYFMPESPLYIYAKGQYNLLEDILRRIATQNGRNETDWYPSYQELLRHKPIKIVHKNELSFPRKLYQLLTHRATIVKFLLTAVIGFITYMLYIKISYGLAMMDNASPYLGILVGAIVETISCLTNNVLISSRLGRKGSFIIMMTLTIIFILLIPIISKYSSIATLIVALFGKYTITTTIAITWIYVPELFPTAIRSTANGFFIVCNRLGAIVAPVINTTVDEDYLPYTFYGSSAFALFVLLFSLVLPETKDKPMDDDKDYKKSAVDL